jgi:FlaA1/EpsC-like NDP-sugar epimerase
MKSILKEYQPQLVFHAAAYKHVPILQNQPREALRNNILGTKIILDLSCIHGVEKFIMISTDKAVNPMNILGVSKRIAEIYTESMSMSTNTKCITVRFGNVLGSTGSVVPLFKEQLKNGGPITVTHPEITRYFMTISEAAELILQAGAMGNGGEIFVLDMGEPVKIKYLAEQIIMLSGKKLDEDIEITYTGLRPGEKLYEELFYDSEKKKTTSHEKIFLAKHANTNESELAQKINEFIEIRSINNIDDLGNTMYDFLNELEGKDSNAIKSGN